MPLAESELVQQCGTQLSGSGTVTPVQPGFPSSLLGRCPRSRTLPVLRCRGCAGAAAEDVATCWTALPAAEERLRSLISLWKEVPTTLLMYLPELKLGITSLFFSLYSGQRQTIQIKTKTSSCGKSQRKTVQGQGKDCICFQVLLHDSDVWAKNITILWCLFPSRCECCLPIFIGMPRNVSKLLGFYNIYSAKDKYTFWQPPWSLGLFVYTSVKDHLCLSNTQWQDRVSSALLAYR